jgi:hypothetical protein
VLPTQSRSTNHLVAPIATGVLQLAEVDQHTLAVTVVPRAGVTAVLALGALTSSQRQTAVAISAPATPISASCKKGVSDVLYSSLSQQDINAIRTAHGPSVLGRSPQYFVVTRNGKPSGSTVGDIV